MTLKEACNRVYNLTIAGYINGEKFTADRFYRQTASLFQDREAPCQVWFAVAQPDGWWYSTINQYRKGEFDWTIPETREQEARIIRAFMAHAHTDWIVPFGRYHEQFCAKQGKEVSI